MKLARESIRQFTTAPDTLSCERGSRPGRLSSCSCRWMARRRFGWRGQEELAREALQALGHTFCMAASADEGTHAGNALVVRRCGHLYSDCTHRRGAVHP